MPPAEPAAPPADPQEQLNQAVAEGQVIALLGDCDPVPMVAAAAAAAGREFAHVDARGLLTLDFDRQVRGHWDGGWVEGALTRMLERGGVFLMAHGEGLVDDLRQRTARMLLTRAVLLHGPRPEQDRTVRAAPGTALVLHVDDHTPVLLQVYTQLKLFALRIRADIAGP